MIEIKEYARLPYDTYTGTTLPVGAPHLEHLGFLVGGDTVSPAGSGWRPLHSDWPLSTDINIIHRAWYDVAMFTWGTDSRWLGFYFLIAKWQSCSFLFFVFSTVYLNVSKMMKVSLDKLFQDPLIERVQKVNNSTNKSVSNCLLFININLRNIDKNDTVLCLAWPLRSCTEFPFFPLLSSVHLWETFSRPPYCIFIARLYKESP